MNKTKFNVNDDVVYTAPSSGQMYEATVKKVNGDGTYEIYEWDRRISHPAKEADISAWHEDAVNF